MALFGMQLYKKTANEKIKVLGYETIEDVMNDISQSILDGGIVIFDANRFVKW